MRYWMVFTAIAVACGSLASAAALDGMKIEVTGAAQDAEWAPIAVPYAGEDWAHDFNVLIKNSKGDYVAPRPEPSDAFGTPKVMVIDDATGKSYGATVRDGALVFVPEHVPANARQQYTVKVVEATDAYPVQVFKKAEQDEIVVMIGYAWFTSYFFSNEERKPYLWPVLGEGGAHLTRDWPMGSGIDTTDHVHHRSLWTAYGEFKSKTVEHGDVWEEHFPDDGWQHTNRVTSGSGGGYGWITADNTWVDTRRKPFISEKREYRFYNTPADKRFFDATITLTADYGDLEVGDTKEGGMLAVRISDILREKGGNGLVTTANGTTADACWGKPSPWCDYSGTLPEGKRGLAVFDYPTNLRHPTRWHVRNYGLMTANCFGLSYFTDKQEFGDMELKAGESLVFNYRVYIHSGDAVEARVAERYQDYVAGPTAKFIK